jgi:hypothetical protein
VGYRLDWQIKRPDKSCSKGMKQSILRNLSSNSRPTQISWGPQCCCELSALMAATQISFPSSLQLRDLVWSLLLTIKRVRGTAFAWNACPGARSGIPSNSIICGWHLGSFLDLNAHFCVENKGDPKVAHRRLLRIVVLRDRVLSAQVEIYKTLIGNGLQWWDSSASNRCSQLLKRCFSLSYPSKCDYAECYLL